MLLWSRNLPPWRQHQLTRICPDALQLCSVKGIGLIAQGDLTQFSDDDLV